MEQSRSNTNSLTTSIGILMSLLYVVPLVIFAGKIGASRYGWDYGLNLLACVVVTFVWIVTFAMEWIIRLRSMHGVYRIPYFGIVGAFALVLLPFLPRLVEPMVLQIPSMSRVQQRVDWPTLGLNSKNAPPVRLYVSGSGNLKHHNFLKATVFWGYVKDANLLRIRLPSLTCPVPGGGGLLFMDVSSSELYSLISNGNIPDVELSLIAEDIMRVLKQAIEGIPLQPTQGTLHALTSAPIDDDDPFFLGVFIWSVVVTIAIMLTSRYSVRYVKDAEQPPPLVL